MGQTRRRLRRHAPSSLGEGSGREFGSAGSGVRRVLSSSLGSKASTTVLRVREHQKGTLAADLDLYVLAGEGTLNGTALGQADYLYLPAGTAIDLVPSVVGLTLYCGFWGDAALLSEAGTTEGVTHLRTEEMEWSSPGWNGDVPLRTGALVKTLREDDRVQIYLAAMVPGWRSGWRRPTPSTKSPTRSTATCSWARAG